MFELMLQNKNGPESDVHKTMPAVMTMRNYGSLYVRLPVEAESDCNNNDDTISYYFSKLENPLQISFTQNLF